MRKKKKESLESRLLAAGKFKAGDDRVVRARRVIAILDREIVGRRSTLEGLHRNPQMNQRLRIFFRKLRRENQRCYLAACRVEHMLQEIFD